MYRFKARTLRFKQINTKEKFPDGRYMLEVILTDQDGNIYRWIPKWKEVKDLYLEARRIEEVNSKTKAVYFDEKKEEVATRIAAYLSQFFATKDIAKVFNLEGKRKHEAIKDILTRARNLEEFKTILKQILNFHEPEKLNVLKKYNISSRDMENDINEIIREIGLRAKYMGSGRWKVEYRDWIGHLSQE